MSLFSFVPTISTLNAQNEITQLNDLFKLYFICKHIFINSAAYILIYTLMRATFSLGTPHVSASICINDQFLFFPLNPPPAQHEHFFQCITTGAKCCARNQTLQLLSLLQVGKSQTFSPCSMNPPVVCVSAHPSLCWSWCVPYCSCV